MSCTFACVWDCVGVKPRKLELKRRIEEYTAIVRAVSPPSVFLLKVHPRHLLRDIGGGVFSFLRFFRCLVGKERSASHFRAECDCVRKVRGERIRKMTLQMLSLNIANSWVEIFAFASVLIGGVWALLQWRRSIEDRRSHMLFDVLKFYFDSRIYDTFTTYIDHPSKEDSEFWNGLKFNPPQVEQKIDEMLLFFSNVCYQKKKGFLPRKEGTLFRYQLVQILSDPQIRDYMAWLKDFAKDGYPFGELDDYAKCNNIEYINNKLAENPKILTEEELEKYLSQHFGGLTNSAKSVKSRINTIMKITGCKLHELVKDDSMFTECMKKIEMDGDSNNAVKSNLKNALRHCYCALHKDEMHK